MLDLGVLGEAEVPTAQETTDCAFKLNLLVKQWMGLQDFAPGLKMWTRHRGKMFLAATKHEYSLGPTGDNWTESFGQTQLTNAASANATTLNVSATSQITLNDYVGIQVGSDIYWTTVTGTTSSTITLPSPGLSGAALSGAYVWNYTTKAQRPEQIVTASLIDIFGNAIPLTFMTVQEYESLSSTMNVQNLSNPSSVYYESQLNNGKLFIDCYGAQDITYYIRMVFLRPVQDFDNPGDAPEYPQRYYRALCWGLSRDIAGMFDAEWTQNMESNYQDAIAIAREADGDRTVMFFEPNA